MDVVMSLNFVSKSLYSFLINSKSLFNDITTSMEDKVTIYIKDSLNKNDIEIPNNNSENEGVNIKSLEDYYYSLKNILYEYAKTHESLKDKKNNE